VLQRWWDLHACMMGMNGVWLGAGDFVWHLVLGGFWGCLGNGLLLMLVL
jgi:hypothetical protein